MRKYEYSYHITHFKMLLGIMCFALILLILSGCSTPTEPKNSLSGSVEISGQTSYADVTVAVYNIVSMDTSLVRINSQFSGIGMHISQETEFDFRERTPILVTQTDTEGNFSFSDITQGNYNIVVYKHGYGFRVFYNYDIQSGDNILNSATANNRIILYPETTLTSLVSTNMVFESGHHYIISGEVNFDQGTTVTIKPGAYIRITPNGILRLRGVVNIQGTADSLIHITSNDGLVVTKGIPTGVRTIQRFNQVSLEQTAVVVDEVIEGCIFTYGDYGLTSTIQSDIKNSIFRMNYSAFKTYQIDDISVENCLFQGSQSAVEMTSINSISFLKNIFYNNNQALYVKIIADGLIKNNYFLNNTNKAIRIEYNSYPDINHNYIAGSEAGIYIHQNCTFLINFNQIICNIGIDTDGNYVTPTVTNNNLYCTQTGFSIRYRSLSGGAMSAQNNYWGVVTSEQISDRIYDVYDWPVGDPNLSLADEVVFVPFRNAALTSAGVEH